MLDSQENRGLCWVIIADEPPHTVKVASRSWYALWLLSPGNDEVSQPTASNPLSAGACTRSTGFTADYGIESGCYGRKRRL